MCIRITKELKSVYENEMRIDLSRKITYPIFCSILGILGYLDKKVGMQDVNRVARNPLIILAWQTIRTKCHPSELYGASPQDDESGPYEEAKAPSSDAQVECVTFENFAMLLSLINNVYIKNKIEPKSSNEVIEEEEEGSESSKRPFGYVDSQGRFMASSRAEVDKIYQKFYALMVNKRTHHEIKKKVKSTAS